MHKPRLLINFKAYLQMKTYCLSVPEEMSALGKAQLVNSLEDYRVRTILPLGQVNNVAHTQFTDDAITDFLYDLAMTGGNPADWNFWFHCHPGDFARWSGEDCENIRKYSQSRPFVSAMMTKHGSILARVDFQGQKLELLPVILPTGHNRQVGKYQRQIRRLVIPEFSEEL